MSEPILPQKEAAADALNGAVVPSEPMPTVAAAVFAQHRILYLFAAAKGLHFDASLEDLRAVTSGIAPSPGGSVTFPSCFFVLTRDIESHIDLHNIKENGVHTGVPIPAVVRRALLDELGIGTQPASVTPPVVSPAPSPQAAAERRLQVGYYMPTPRFRSVTEMVAVFDANRPEPDAEGQGGEVVALFGPSLAGGATAEYAAASHNDALLFRAAPDLLRFAKADLHRATLKGLTGCKFWEQLGAFFPNIRSGFPAFEDLPQLTENKQMPEWEAYAAVDALCMMLRHEALSETFNIDMEVGEAPNG